MNIQWFFVREDFLFLPVSIYADFSVLINSFPRNLAKKNLRVETISIFVNCTYKFRIISEILVSRNKQKIDRKEGNIYLSRELNFTLFWIFVMVFHF